MASTPRPVTLSKESIVTSGTADACDGEDDSSHSHTKRTTFPGPNGYPGVINPPTVPLTWSDVRSESSSPNILIERSIQCFSLTLSIPLIVMVGYSVIKNLRHPNRITRMLLVQQRN